MPENVFVHAGGEKTTWRDGRGGRNANNTARGWVGDEKKNHTAAVRASSSSTRAGPSTSTSRRGRAPAPIDHRRTLPRSSRGGSLFVSRRPGTRRYIIFYWYHNYYNYYYYYFIRTAAIIHGLCERRRVRPTAKIAYGSIN